MSSICRVWCVLAEIFVRVGVWNELVGGGVGGVSLVDDYLTYAYLGLTCTPLTCSLPYL